MSQTLRISAAPPDRISLDYARLREGGMQSIRALAKDSWTDHNVHDPGITLLEAASYAITELGLKLQLDIADLLRSGQAHAEAEYEPAHRVLPVGPVNARDLRALLLDHPLVSDAQIFHPGQNEVAFYEVDADPPLTFVPPPVAPVRSRTAGLYDVLVELSQRDLNSNTYPLPVLAAGDTWDIEVALPCWDDIEAAPFHWPVTLDAVVMLPDAGVFWRALPEPQSYFGRIRVDYTDLSGAPGSMQAWVLLRVVEKIAQPGLVVPAILVAARAAIETNLPGAPLSRFAIRVREAAVAVAQLADYVAGWRNLGEQAVRIGLARVQEIALNARLEVTGGIDVEALLARIFLDIDAMLSPYVRFQSLAERRVAEPDPDSIYDGPLLRRGFLDRATSGRAIPDVIYTSDILRRIMQRRGGGGDDVVTQEDVAARDIVAVTDLTLANFINNRPITSGAEDCLHLVQIARYRPRLSLAKSRITVVRNDVEVAYDTARVLSLFQAMQAQALDEAFTDAPSPVWPVVSGDVLPVDEYTPLQMDLPALFGTGDAALPDSASAERHAAVRQLQGYLLLFEQFLGDMTVQLGHINRFYSGNGEAGTTYVTRPPFDLPGAPRLLRQFPAGGNWAAFIADPDNPVAGALRQAAETRERLLDRRNRILDHRLARQGEDAAALAQEVHRWARAELDVRALPPAQQEQRVADRREAADARLLRLKSALLRETPELSAMRMQALSNPVQRDEGMLAVLAEGVGFRWMLSPDGQPRLRGAAPEATDIMAAISGERALAFAARTSNYIGFDSGSGVFRLRLTDGAGVAAQAIGESVQTFVSLVAANAAAPALAALFAAARIEPSLSPLERKLAHHSGIRNARRRRALRPIGDFFEIFDEPAPPGFVGRRWRLRETMPAGAVLLASDVRYDDTTAAGAVALAEQSIGRVLRYGMDEWNYRAVPAGGNTFAIQLRDPTGLLLAVGQGTFASAALAQAGIEAAVAMLYREYGAETMYLLEHLLLRPLANTDALLSLPEGEGRERDPYSHRLSLVLPSGYARDFALAPADAVRTPVTPDRFRSSEFRRHVEGMVQRCCPAHLLIKVFWVDRESPASASPASFDTFETRYLAWLDTVLVPGAPAAAVSAARNALVEALNAIANDA
ncbi:hypothetical protein ABU614_18035 [Lysobacter firmicutimachus]|uniref:Uncharacterized protein n=1 Tax=Lysobacter firmicutimachus TaxID=1792846 RepID=A0AAU8MRN2_9GAMM